MGELLQLKRETGAALCLECGKCSTMCPLAIFGGFSAARMMSIQDPEAEIQGHAEAVQRCLTCSSCEERCPQGVRYTDFVRGLRQHVPAEDRVSCPHGEVLQAAARLSGESTVVDRPHDWLRPGLEVAEEGEVALFVGCLPQFDVVFANDLGVEMVEIARAAIRVLNRLGIQPVLVADERCCGHDLLWGGSEPSFEQLARANIDAFRRRGVQHILTTCAECCRTWRLDYPKVEPEYQPQVEHLAEFLSRHLDRDEISFRPTENGELTFHDPCRLGRQLGVYEAPREVLAAVPGAQLIEIDRSGADALCCGTPGFIHCDASSRRLQIERLRGAADTGASTLVTACPKCLIHFRCAQSEDRRVRPEAPTIQIEDLTIFASRMLTAVETPSADPPQVSRQTGEAK